MRKKTGVDQESPIDVVSFDTEEISILEDSAAGLTPENLINKIPPAKWEALIGILNFLTKDSDDAVIIKDSIILYGYKGGSIIKVNLSEIFGGEKINLHISSPKKWTRLFKTLKDSDIYILDESNKFVVTNGQIKLFLPKQLNSFVNTLEFPDFSETETTCSLVFQKDSRDTILELSKNITYIEHLIKNKKLMSINIPNTAVFILPEYVKDKEAQELTSSTSDLTLRTQVFLPYPADTYNLLIGHNLITDNYFAYTVCNSSSISIELYEQLDNSSGIDSLF